MCRVVISYHRNRNTVQCISMEFEASLKQQMLNLQNEIINIFSQCYTTNTVNRIVFADASKFVVNIFCLLKIVSLTVPAIKPENNKKLSYEQIYDHKLTPHSKLLTVPDSVFIFILSSFLYSLQSLQEVHNEM